MAAREGTAEVVDPILPLFRQCVVRVDVEGEFRGTGFFVTSDEVVTCAHVVHRAGSVTVAGRDRDSKAEVLLCVPELAEDDPQAGFYPFPDLALLRVEEPPDSQPCVLLDAAEPSAASRPDVLGLYGYSLGEYRGGEVAPSPAAVDYKGPLDSGGERLLKLGDDQVLRGYSGCPALNLRTGGVCAVIDSTRDAKQDLGGFGVPVAAFERALPGVLERNREWHEANPTWRQTEEQQALAERSRQDLEPLPLQPGLTALNWAEGDRQSDLLKPRYGVVELVGRKHLQDRLMKWRESDDALRIALITGGGGFGKTRLALEECEKAGRAGWTAGMLGLEEKFDQERVLTQLTSWPARLLVAIDYAETRPALVGALIQRLLRREGGPPVRLILICRQAQTKPELERLFATGDSHDDVAKAISRADPIRLDEEELDRRGLFESGVASFRSILGSDTDETPAPSLREEHFSRPLFVLAAALLVSQDPQTKIDSMSQDELMLEMLDRHESWYWRRLAEELKIELDPEIQWQAVAASTVMGADGEEEAMAVVGVVPALEDASSERRRSVASWLSRLYSLGRLDSAPALGPIEPDMLAEALVTNEYTAHPRLLERSLDVATDKQLVQALAVITRAAAGSEPLRELFRAALDERLPDLVRRAGKGGDRLTTALELAIAEARPRQGGVAVLKADSPEFGELGTLSVPIHAVAAEHFALMAQEEPGRYLAPFASSLVTLSTALSDERRHAEALSAVEEAVKARRILFESDADRFRLALASSLNRQAFVLHNLGRGAEAQAAIEEAIELRRKLVESGDDRASAGLAGSLNDLSNRLCEAGRYEEAVAAMEESSRIYRALAEGSGEDYASDLAMSQSNLSVVLGHLGRRNEALPAIEEAVELRRGLVAEDRRHLPDLAGTLNNLSNQLEAQGRTKEALEAIEEAVDHYRGLVGENPERYKPDLAMSLNNLSNRLDSEGKLELSREAIEEAIALRRKLIESEGTRHLSDLTDSLNNFSAVLIELGRYTEGIPAIEEAVDHYRELAKEHPDRFFADLAMALNNLAVVYGEVGRPERALGAIEEAVELRRKLVERNRTRFGPDLATSLNNMSTVLREIGRSEEGLRAIEEAVELRREAVERTPGGHIGELIGSLSNLSNALGDVGDREAALKAIEEALDLHRELAQNGAVRYLHPLSTLLSNYATRLKASDRPQEALKAVEEALGMRRQLAAENPGRHLGLLAMSLNSLTDISLALDRGAEARSAIEAAIEEHGPPAPAPLELSLAQWHSAVGDTGAALKGGVVALSRAGKDNDVDNYGQARIFLRNLRIRHEEEFDSIWAEGSWAELPVWLRHPDRDMELIELLVKWIQTSSWDASQEFLEAHEELFSDRGEAMLEHLMDDRRGVLPELTQHRRIQLAARKQGVAATYRQVFEGIEDAERRNLIEQWLELAIPESQGFLEEHASTLLDARAEESLAGSLLKEGAEGAAFGRLGLLRLARVDGLESAYEQLGQGIEALDDADCLAESQRPLAVARIRAGLDDQDADRQFQHALAAAAAGFEEEGDLAMVRCRQLLPAWEVDRYLARLDALAADGSLPSELARLRDVFLENDEVVA